MTNMEAKQNTAMSSSSSTCARFPAWCQFRWSSASPPFSIFVISRGGQFSLQMIFNSFAATSLTISITGKSSKRPVFEKTASTHFHANIPSYITQTTS